MNAIQENHPRSRTALIRALAKTDPDAAVRELGGLLGDAFDIDVANLAINYDQYSLNSLNGFFDSGDRSFFFKFHQEEGEEDMKGEYYRADLLSKANLPIDLPVWKSSMPGEQILVYHRRNDRRFSDVLRDLDENPDADAISKVGAAERQLNDRILSVATSTLHEVDAGQVGEEPIHHLFHDRMIDLKTGRSPGGRYANFYVGKPFEFPGCSLTWDQFSAALPVLNGQAMASTFGEIFARALTKLNPKNLASAGGFTAHGDAHNANVWYIEEGEGASLSYFDPAFAGEHIPSLLAEAKATFHNVFAHPFWLYDPGVAHDRYTASAFYDDGELRIDTDWRLSDVRRELLDAKATAFWKPFLAHLAERGMLPADWRQTMRLALAMCPTLVMNLRAGADRHNPTSSAIGFLVAGLVGSEPVSGRNVVTEFFDRIDPAQAGRDAGTHPEGNL